MLIIIFFYIITILEELNWYFSKLFSHDNGYVNCDRIVTIIHRQENNLNNKKKKKTISFLITLLLEALDAILVYKGRGYDLEEARFILSFIFLSLSFSIHSRFSVRILLFYREDFLANHLSSMCPSFGPCVVGFLLRLWWSVALPLPRVDFGVSIDTVNIAPSSSPTWSHIFRTPWGGSSVAFFLGWILLLYCVCFCFFGMDIN